MIGNKITLGIVVRAEDIVEGDSLIGDWHGYSPAINSHPLSVWKSRWDRQSRTIRRIDVRGKSFRMHKDELVLVLRSFEATNV